MWDRIIQQCILQVLEPIGEAKFHVRSNGFRPNRSTEHALAQCYKMAQQQNLHFVVDIDIKGFFDNVNHGKLLKQIWAMGIQDKNLLCIISKMLKAKVVMPDGTTVEVNKGTPQGGILSPLLSNIVLNELDWWIASNREEMPTRTSINEIRANGTLDRSNKYKALRKSNLKECFMVRYADDFKIFCPDYKTATRIFHATKLWLRDRLHLEISEEKSKIVNLKKEYSEFLGFEMKVIKHGNKYKVKSHICKKAKERIANELKEIIKQIKYPKGDLDELRKIGLYNSKVIGIHQYYKIATMVSQDLSEIAYQIKGSLENNKLKKRISKTGATQGYIKEVYGQSQQLRYIRNTPLVPLAYITHQSPMFKRREINKYTPSGRAFIHKQLESVDLGTLKWLMQNPVKQRSVEYNDNRLSLYSAQKGRCAVTGNLLMPFDIHRHHKVPLDSGGTDAYSNLVLISREVHELIHAKLSEAINAYMTKLNLTQPQLRKLNKLRIIIGNEEIIE